MSLGYTATIIHPDGCEVQEEIIVPDATRLKTYTQNECSNNNDGSITLNITMKIYKFKIIYEHR